MRRRLLVAKALVHRPPVVILDEPTAGVDVELRRSLWRYMHELNRQGVTVVLTTHYLEEAEAMCDRIAIIDRGQVVACDAKAALIGRLDEKRLTVAVAEPIATLPAELAALGARLDGERRLVISYRPSRARVGELLDAVRRAGLTITDLATAEADLEELFLRLTGHGGRIQACLRSCADRRRPLARHRYEDGPCRTPQEQKPLTGGSGNGMTDARCNSGKEVIQCLTPRWRVWFCRRTRLWSRPPGSADAAGNSANHQARVNHRVRFQRRCPSGSGAFF